MSELQIKLIKDLSEAKNIWNIFTPQETIYDEWNFRYCFYKYFNYELFFYVGYLDGQPIGLLPLEYNTDKNFFEYFGTSFMEDNRVMIKPGYENLIPSFFKILSKKINIQYLKGSDPYTSSLEIKDYKFTLDLKKIETIDSYFNNFFGTETRKNLKKCFKKITEKNLSIVLNNFDDIELLFKYNERKFKEESSFVAQPFRKQIYKELLSLPYEPVLLTFIIDGIKEGVSFCLKYKTVYESFNTGTRSDDIKNLFAFMIMKNIENALEMKMSTYDAFCGDSGWKEKWGFTKIPQYKFEIT